jgi:hypothetical protein
MSVSESELLRRKTNRPVGERRFQVLAVTALFLLLAYLGAALAGSPRQASSPLFSLIVFPVPFVVWCAYARAPENLRAPTLLCASATSLWLADSLAWYGFILAGRGNVPPSPAWWVIFFFGARLLLIAAVISAIRSLAFVRVAALDACVIVAAGVALGALLIGHGSVEQDVSAATLSNLNPPLLGIVALVLIAAAALGSRDLGYATGSLRALLVTMLSIALTLGVATYGLVTDRRTIALTGLLAGIAIAIAMALRARASVRIAELSSELLDKVLAESQRAREELHAANARLQRTNANLRTLQIAVAQGFNLIDERTQGRLRELVEHAGDDLAALVEETLDD